MSHQVSQSKQAKAKYSRWIRLYVDIVDDMKAQRLNGNAFKVWINLLALGGQNNGILPSIDEIAFRLRMSQNDAANFVDELVSLGFIDVVSGIGEPTVLSPHNWDKRQFKWDADPTNRLRQKRHRDRRVSSRNGRRNGRVTDGVTEIPSVSVSVSASVLEDRLYSSQGRNSGLSVGDDTHESVTNGDEVLS